MCMLLFSLWKNATKTCSKLLRFGRRSGREGTGTAEAFKGFVIRGFDLSVSIFCPFAIF